MLPGSVEARSCLIGFFWDRPSSTSASGGSASTLGRDGTRPSQEPPQESVHSPWDRPSSTSASGGSASTLGRDGTRPSQGSPARVRAYTLGPAEFHLGQRWFSQHPWSRWNSTLPGTPTRVRGYTLGVARAGCSLFFRDGRGHWLRCYNAGKSCHDRPQRDLPLV